MEKLNISGSFKKEIIVLAIFSAICTLLFLFRQYKSNTDSYLFLNWNLLLAAIPWLLSSLLLKFKVLHKNKVCLIITISIWALFFPNAPYILTDLYHIRHIYSMPLWFDLLLILLFAWTGLMFGYLSLQHIERLFIGRIPAIVLSSILIAFFFMVGLGIYLGRYLRWNSWDIIKYPKLLFVEVSDIMLNPTQHPQAWGMTFLMGIFLIVTYSTSSILLSNNLK